MQAGIEGQIKPVLNIEGNTKGHWDAGRISQMLQ
ncbi:hypothetical protein PSYPI_49262, partial [Pseudomonas syringae pv. pisi str. 1704B]